MLHDSNQYLMCVSNVMCRGQLPWHSSTSCDSLQKPCLYVLGKVCTRSVYYKIIPTDAEVIRPDRNLALCHPVP